MAKKQVPRRKDSNLRQPLTRESSRPASLKRYGKAGIRVLIDEMIESHHGRPRDEWLGLGSSGLEILHRIASGIEPHHFRNRSIAVLGVIADSSSVPVLSEVARDKREHPIVRVAGTFSLGEIGGDKARDVLQDLLRDEEVLVRHRAAEALGKLGDERALQGLRVAASQDPVELVREAAGRAIERIELVRDFRGGGDRSGKIR